MRRESPEGHIDATIVHHLCHTCAYEKQQLRLRRPLRLCDLPRRRRQGPGANPKYTVEKNGKTYGFVGLIPKLIFQAIPGSAERADKAWAKRQN